MSVWVGITIVSQIVVAFKKQCDKIGAGELVFKTLSLIQTDWHCGVQTYVIGKCSLRVQLSSLVFGAGFS